jgi:single-strand DNA-binding protein
MSINKHIIVGRVGNNPKIFEKNSKVVKFSVATNFKFRNQSGEYIEETEWHNVTAFNKLADICEQLIQKGSMVYVEGRVKTEEYNDKQYKYIILEKIDVLSSKKEMEYETTDKIYSTNNSQHSLPDNSDLPF